MVNKEILHVVETFEALPGKIEEFKKALLNAVPLSRKEEGCLYYNLFQDRSDPHKFAVLMGFKNQDAYDAHIAAPYIQTFPEVYQNVVEVFYKQLL